MITDERPLKFSFPPYFVGTMAGGLPIMSLPGDFYQMLARGMAPTAAEASAMLVTLRRTLGWSRTMLAAFLGVSREVVRRWETGGRNPSAPARRLIWLVMVLVTDRKKLQNGMDMVFWGKGRPGGLRRARRARAARESVTRNNPSSRHSQPAQPAPRSTPAVVSVGA